MGCENKPRRKRIKGAKDRVKKGAQGGNGCEQGRWDVSHAQMNATNVWKMESEGGRKQMNRMKYLGVAVAVACCVVATRLSRIEGFLDGMGQQSPTRCQGRHSSEGSFFWQAATSVSCTGKQTIFLRDYFDIPVGSMVWGLVGSGDGDE